MQQIGATSFAYPIDRAIVALVKGDTGAGGLLAPGALLLDPAAPVWSGIARKGAALDYIVLGDSSETDAPSALSFDAYAFANTLTVHVWTKDTSRKSATRILARLLYLLHRQPIVLTLPDGVTPLARIRGTFSTVTVIPDPGGEVSHGVGRYEVTSRQPSRA